MKVFYCTDHDTFYPVGSGSVIVAEDREAARKIFAAELKARGLDPDKGFTLVEVDLARRSALILCDGDY
jgi:hypothetical protein